MNSFNRFSPANPEIGNWGRFDSVPVQPAGVTGVPQAYADVAVDPKKGLNGFTVTIIPPEDLTSLEAAFFIVEYGSGGIGSAAISSYVRRRVSFNVPGSTVRVKAWLQYEPVTPPGVAPTKRLGVFVSQPARAIQYPLTTSIFYQFPGTAAYEDYFVNLAGTNARELIFTSVGTHIKAPIPLEILMGVFTVGGTLPVLRIVGASDNLAGVRIPEQAMYIQFINRNSTATDLHVALVEEF